MPGRRAGGSGPSGSDTAPCCEEQEALALQRALQSARWNKSKAANLLGISRRTIYRKMEKFGFVSRET